MNLQSLTFNESGGNTKIYIHGTAEWNVSADIEWIKFSNTNGSGDNIITVTADANNTATSRMGVITFIYGNTKTSVNVTQTGEAVRLNVEPLSIFVNANGTGESITISSNTSWTIKTTDSWVTCSPNSGNGNATITVSASAYSTGTRYSSLTITDATGEISYEISIAQASSREELATLKNWLEKPMGIIDVNMRTASYQTVKNAISKSYVIEEGKFDDGDLYFHVWGSKNPTLSELTYQGLPLSSVYVRKSAFDKGIHVGYSFDIYKSDAAGDYNTYFNNILQDFKYNIGVSLEKKSDDSDYYKGKDANTNYYSVRGSISTSSSFGDEFIFDIEVDY